MLSKDEIAKAMRGPVKLVDVPEWGGQIGIRKLSAVDLMYLRGLTHSEAGDSPKEDNPEENLSITCELLSLSLCDETGKRLFAPAELREWDGQQSATMQLLIQETQTHNGISEAATEELRKNSESGQTSDST